MGSPAFFTNHLLPHTEAYVNQLTNVSTGTIHGPSGKFIGYVNALIAGMIIDGYWYELDRLWIFATEQRAHANVSLVNPNGLNAAWPTNIANGGVGVNWNSAGGYIGVSSAYLDSNYNPSVAGGQTGAVNCGQDSTTIGVYNITNSSVNNYAEIGVSNSPLTWSWYISCRNAMGKTAVAVNDNGYGVTNSSPLGLIAAQRQGTGTTPLEAFSNGSPLLPASGNSSVTPSNLNVYILADNNNGTASSFSLRQLPMAFWGSGNISMSTFYSRILIFAGIYSW